MSEGPHRLVPALMVAAFAVSGCAGGSASPAAPVSAPTEPSRSAPTAVAATPTDRLPSPTSILSLAIDALPRVELAQVDATAVCDPEPGLADDEAGDSMIECPDGLVLALRAVRALTKDPAVRVYLQRPSCASGPCSQDELSTADVTVWTETDTYSVRLDARLETVSRPMVTGNPVWPAAGHEPAPVVKRPSITGATVEVADRKPYPFCGLAEIDRPPAVFGCFRDAVLAGRQAEMIDRLYGTEGGQLLVIYRFDGHGRLISYQHDQTVTGDGRASDTWRRAEGAMILGARAEYWSFDPWSGRRLTP